jgi:hypothetical protein
MAKQRPFNSELVIDERISLPDLRGYHIGFDQKKFRLEPLVDVIRSVIPEYALGYHEGQSVPLPQIIERAKDAAKTIFSTDKYKRRGEFGELILHLLLRDFHGTIPLISTIYFRDAVNVPAHGFDGVHVIDITKEKKLVLGESKLYTSGGAGITDLLKDMKNHLENDYLRQQFNLVSRKIPAGAKNVQHWRTLLHKNQRLDIIFNSIVIPMVCTYNSDLFLNHNDNTNNYFQEFEEECHKLFKKFSKGKSVSKVEFILMLLPIPCKDTLNKKLYAKVKAMQEM